MWVLTTRSLLTSALQSHTASMIAYLLKRHGLAPALQRVRGSWRRLLKHYRHHVLACEFFSIETLGLHTLYILFFIELNTQRILLAQSTAHPTGAWVTQQSHNLIWHLDSFPIKPKALIHDRDTKFTHAFDAVLTLESITVLRTPYRTPNANAVAERWVRIIREECLDPVLIFSQLTAAGLRRVHHVLQPPSTSSRDLTTMSLRTTPL